MSTFSSSKSATRVVSLGRPPRVDGAAVNPPIAMSSTFVGSGYVTAENRVYARFSNAAWEPLEDAIGQLEGSPTAGLAYASGLAAVSAVFDLVPGGGVLVIPTASYNGTIALARALSADGKLSCVKLIRSTQKQPSQPWMAPTCFGLSLPRTPSSR